MHLVGFTIGIRKSLFAVTDTSEHINKISTHEKILVSYLAVSIIIPV